MKSADVVSNRGGSSSKTGLSQVQWNLLALPAIALAVMAILQAISFGKFKDWLDGIGVGAPAVVAAVVIVAELFGAASFLQINMDKMIRFVGLSVAVIVSMFWFIETLMLVTTSTAQSTNSGLFGKYLSQAPGWWTVAEVSVLLFWVIYSAELLSWRPKNWR